MKEKKYYRAQAIYSRNHEIYRLRVVEGLDVVGISEKLGISRVGVYRALSTFEHENTQQASQMKTEGKKVGSGDNQELLTEIARLKKELSQERLRADFYEEMVAFGKEVYGIDLKKAGTK